MAMQIEGTEKRGNIYYLPASAIQVDWSANGRYAKPTGAELADLKASIKEHGQQQPVIVRTVKTEKGQQAVLVAGFCRVEAISQLNQESGGDPILVACTGLPRVNDEDAFRLNVEENMRRKALSPLDIAYSIRRWEQVYQKGMDEVAAIYQRPTRWVHEHKKLLVLDKQTMQQVHNGEMTMSAALDLAAMPEETRQEVRKVLDDKEAAGSMAELPRDPNEEPKEPGTSDTTTTVDTDFSDVERGLATGNPPAKPKKNSKGKVDRAAVVAAAREVGVKRARNWNDLKRVLVDLEQRAEVPKAILQFMSGDLMESDLRAILRGQKPA